MAAARARAPAAAAAGFDPSDFDDVTWHAAAPPDMRARGVVIPHCAVASTCAVPVTSPFARLFRGALTLKPAPTPGAPPRKPKRFFTEVDGVLEAPRFAWLTIAAGVRPAIDLRDGGAPVHAGGGGPAASRYAGTLLPFQRAAVRQMVAFHEAIGGGVLIVPCGMGKSEVACALTALTAVRTVVVVPQVEQMDQMYDKMRARCPALSVRRVGDVHKWAPRPRGGGAKRARHDAETTESAEEDGPLPDVLVCTMQSLARGSVPDGALRGVGHVIVDEAHHCPADTMVEVMARLPAARVTGMTATLRRSDGFEAVVAHLLGPVAIEVQVPWRPALVRRARVRLTRATRDAIERTVGKAQAAATRRQDIITHIANDATRNVAALALVGAVARRVRKRNPRACVLVMTDRRRHAIELGGFVLNALQADDASDVAERKRANVAKLLERQEAADGKRAELRPDMPACDPLTDIPDDDEDLMGFLRTLWTGVACEVYVGTLMTRKRRIEAAEREPAVYWLTGDIAYEGLNIPHVHAVVILSMFGKDMEQPVGRGRRIDTQHDVPEYYLMQALGSGASSVQRNADAHRDYFQQRETWPVADLPVVGKADASAAKTMWATTGAREPTKGKDFPTGRAQAVEWIAAARAQQRSRAKAAREAAAPRVVLSAATLEYGMGIGAGAVDPSADAASVARGDKVTMQLSVLT